MRQACLGEESNGSTAATRAFVFVIGYYGNAIGCHGDASTCACNVYQALFSPPLRKRAWVRGYLQSLLWTWIIVIRWTHTVMWSQIRTGYVIALVYTEKVVTIKRDIIISGVQNLAILMWKCTIILLLCLYFKVTTTCGCGQNVEQPQTLLGQGPTNSICLAIYATASYMMF